MAEACGQEWSFLPMSSSSLSISTVCVDMIDLPISLTSTWYVVEDSDVPVAPEDTKTEDSDMKLLSTMSLPKANDAELGKLLSRNYANVTGGEVHSQPIIVVPASSWRNLLYEDISSLTTLFRFIVWASSCHYQPSHSTQLTRYLIVSDLRDADWGQVKQLLALFKDVLPPGVQRVVLLTRSNRLSLAKFSIKSFLDELPFKVETLNTPQSLKTMLPASDLPVELGGLLKYNNDDWMYLFIKGETLCDTCKATSTTLSETKKDCQTFTVLATATETKSAIDELHEDVESALEHAQQLLDRCMEFVSKMLTEHHKYGLASSTNHYAGIPSRVQAALTALSMDIDQLTETWKWQKERLDNFRRTQSFRELMDQVSNDIEAEHQKMSKDFGTSLSTARSLLADHKALTEMLMTGIIASGNVLAAESHVVVERPHCYKADQLNESACKLTQLQQALVQGIEQRTSNLEMSVELQTIVEQGTGLCEEGLHLLATQSMEQCLSEGGTADVLTNLSRYLDRLEDTDTHKMDLIVHALPPNNLLSEQVRKLKKKMGEIQNLVTARIEGVHTLSSKHNELKGQLTAHAEGSSLSGASTGSVTPPPLQDTAGSAACASSLSSDTSSKSSPRHDRAHRFQDRIAHSRSSGALVTPRVTPKGFTSPQTGHRPYPMTRSSTVGGSSSDKITSAERQSHHSSLHFSPARGISFPSQLDSSLGEDSGVFSGVIEDSETNSRVLEKRGYIMAELIETERTYIDDLQETLDYYWTPMRPDNEAVPASWRAKRNILFGNLPRLLEFHKTVFRDELESCADNPERVGLCFLNKQRQFQLYVSYCKNKYKSDAFLAELDMNFFEEIRKKRGHRLSLKTFLIKPVQRITKYQLLLKEMMAQCKGAPEAMKTIQCALDNMLDILQHVNNVMHSIGIIGFPGSLLEQGHLLLQNSFHAWRESGGRLKLLRNNAERERHVFLYEQVLILSKKRQPREGDRQTLYSYKDSIKISELALTETSDGGESRFQVAHHNHAKAYTLQAPSVKVKHAWVGELRNLLEQQLTHMQNIARQEEGLLTLPRAPGHRASESASTIGSTASGAAGTNTTAVGLSPASILQARGVATVKRSASVSSHWSQNTLTRRRIAIESSAPTTAITMDSMDDADGLDATRSLGRNVSDDSLRGVGGSSLDADDEAAADEDVDIAMGLQGDLCDPSFIVASPSNRQFCAVTADFRGTEEGEVRFVVGDAVEVLQLGHGGWWEVRKVETNEIGWIPASYLQEISSKSLLPVLETSI
ncbi:uncharacterized protein LOC135810241 isoform X2 [Sycon ciliatum]|uniref:uncharacterized protein LOC135810241 isoform X2 n=1 Tax=Sycon ciliatum TaxID=27933 RepID=UPI0031F6A848